jgi:hypothetical protein
MKVADTGAPAAAVQPEVKAAVEPPAPQAAAAPQPGTAPEAGAPSRGLATAFPRDTFERGIGAERGIGDRGVIGRREVPPRTVADVTTGMTPQQRAAYDALDAQTRQRYDALHRDIPDPSLSQLTREQRTQNIRGLLEGGNASKYFHAEDALRRSSHPHEAESLNVLLQNGKLLSRSTGGQTMLDAVSPLIQGGMTNPMTGGPKVDRHELLAQIVKDVRNPEGFVQGEGNKDCSGIAVAYMMARESPANYAAMNTTLAEHGFATQFRGIGVPGNHLSLRGPIDPGQSLTQQLFARSFSAMAAGTPGITHDGVTGQGLMNALNAGIYTPGRFERYSAMYVPDEQQMADPAKRAEARAAALQVLQEQGAAGKMAFANINGHWVVPTLDGQGQVSLMDLSGKTTVMPLDRFLEGLNSVVYDNAHSRPPEWAQNHAWGKPGTGTPRGGGSTGGNDYLGG